MKSLDDYYEENKVEFWKEFYGEEVSKEYIEKHLVEGKDEINTR